MGVIKRMVSAALVFCQVMTSLIVSAENAHNYTGEKPISEILGVTHVSGRYYFTEKDFLNEGADALLELGTKVIKLWLTSDYGKSYYPNSQWPHSNSMTELLQSPYYDAVLRKPFKTYIFEAVEFGKAKWHAGLSEQDREMTINEFYEAAKYLLTQFKGSGKTFILQNWEGDGALNVKALSIEQVPVAVQGMRDWLNARQEGVTRARDEVGMDGVVVANCVEMDHVPANHTGDVLVVDEVVPYTRADLYSFSSWGTRMPGDEPLLIDKLNYIASKAPASKLFGEKNVMLGEFGQYELDTGIEPLTNEGSGQLQMTSVQRQLEYAIEWGVPYALYWQLYCNGLRPGITLELGQKATNDQLRGVWLIRPDGSKTPTYHYFKELFASNKLSHTQIPYGEYYRRPAKNLNPTGAALADPPRPAPPKARPINQVLGIVHVSGKYHFTDQDFMNEGADQIQALGSRVIKLWLTHEYKKAYPYNSVWEDGVTDFAELLKQPYYQSVLNRDWFKTYVLEAIETNLNWKDGLSDEETERARDQMYQVTKYLLQAFQGTGKTFILQNWEGDNALAAETMNEQQTQAALQGMIAWFNARQAGVDKAREELGMDGVVVAHCVEMNHVLSDKDNLVVDRVVPHTNADLYSLSSWGTRMPGDEDLLADKLDYIASKAPASELFGEKNVMLGEFGQYELSTGMEPFTNEGSGQLQLTSVRKQLENALEWGVPYALYWQLYCNGLRDGVSRAAGENATNEQLKGVWLIRADGSKTPTYHYFKELFTDNEYIPGATLDLSLFAEKTDKINVRIDELQMDFAYQEPVLLQNRVLVPMRAIFETFRAQVAWDGDTQTITAASGGDLITLRVGENEMTINESAIPLDAAPVMINGHTMVPVRSIAEALGCAVEWEGDTATVSIKTLPGAATRPAEKLWERQ